MKKTVFTIFTIFVLSAVVLGVVPPLPVQAAVQRFSVQSPDEFHFGAAVETKLIFLKGFQYEGKVACSPDDGKTWFALPQAKVYANEARNSVTLRQDGPLAAVGTYLLRFSSAKKDGSDVKEHSMEIHVKLPSMMGLQNLKVSSGQEVPEVKFYSISPFVTSYKWTVKGAEGQLPTYGKGDRLPAFSPIAGTGREMEIMVYVTPYVRMVAGETQQLVITVTT